MASKDQGEEILPPDVAVLGTTMFLSFSDPRIVAEFKRWMTSRRPGNGWECFYAWLNGTMTGGPPAHVHPDEMPCNVMCPAHPNTVKTRGR